MAKTIAQLRQEAQTIRDASAVGENTATRVGGTIEDVVDYVENAIIAGAGHYDLSISDPNGNNIAVFKGGHVRTKFFNSAAVVFVDRNGNGQYRTISDAINGTADGDTIIVNSGIYEEQIEMWGKERHIVGVCKETCIITNGTGNYDTPPLEANIGSISNVTIIADNYAPTIPDPSGTENRASYAIHIEYANTNPFAFKINNCILKAKWFPAVGLGLRYNQQVIIENTELITYADMQLGALFFHNDAVSSQNGTGVISVRNCVLRSYKQTLGLSSVSSKPAKASAEFIGCTFKSDTLSFDSLIFKKYTTTAAGYLCGDRILLADTSHGNNVEELNA